MYRQNEILSSSEVASSACVLNTKECVCVYVCFSEFRCVSSVSRPRGRHLCLPSAAFSQKQHRPMCAKLHKCTFFSCAVHFIKHSKIMDYFLPEKSLECPSVQVFCCYHMIALSRTGVGHPYFGSVLVQLNCCPIWKWPEEYLSAVEQPVGTIIQLFVFSFCTSDVSDLSKVYFEQGFNEGVSGMLTTVNQGHLVSWWKV